MGTSQLRLPDSVSFVLTLADGRQAKVTTPRDDEGKLGAYYHGGKRRSFSIPVEGTSQEILDSIESVHLVVDGEAIELTSALPAHVSEPRRYAATAKAVLAGTAKVGAVVPGTGGNMTRTWSGSVKVPGVVVDMAGLPVLSADGTAEKGEKGFTAQFTITATKEPFRIDAKLRNQAAGRGDIGIVEDFEALV